jgi:hypothetical protein
LATFFTQTLVDTGLGARRLLLEDVRGIADQRQHPFVADARESVSAGGLAEHRSLVDLPVAGVENPSVRRLDQHAIALRDRVGEGNEAHVERPELDLALAVDDVERNVAGQPLFLELRRR